jgi:hypothetical protein
MGERVPDLLAGDDPLVAIADGLAGESGEIRAGAGFAEELTPVILAREDATESLAFRVFITMGDDGGSSHREAEEVGGVDGRSTGGLQASVNLLLMVRGEIQTTEALGEVHPGEPEVILPATELLVLACARVEFTEELINSIADERFRRDHGHMVIVENCQYLCHLGFIRCWDYRYHRRLLGPSENHPSLRS